MSTDPDAVPGPVPGGPEGRATSSLWLATRPVAPRSAPFEPGRRYDTAVVGAGITGLATAVLLARAGQRVVLIEKSGIGAVTTGHTTAKLSLLQGLSLSRVRSHQGDEVLAAHVSANLAGQEWLLGFLDAHGVGYQRRTAYTYATTVAGEELLTDELAASRAAGLPVTRADDTGLPYEVRAAIQLPDQVQFHPMDVLAALLAEFESLGGVLHVGVRVHGLRMGTPCTVVTLAGDVDADHVVLATGTPIVDRGAHFARLKALRSYALALEVPGAPATIPQGMYLSVDEPVRTLRTDYPWVAAVLQAMLFRTSTDCAEHTAEGARVRLCKGAYAEPAEVAHRSKSAIDRNYKRCATILLEGAGRPLFATHDSAMIEHVRSVANRVDRSQSSYELQMLLGIRSEEQRRLAGLGHQVRVYVPFGTDWYAYFMRRLAERPANVMFLMRALVERPSKKSVPSGF